MRRGRRKLVQRQYYLVKSAQDSQRRRQDKVSSYHAYNPPPFTVKTGVFTKQFPSFIGCRCRGTSLLRKGPLPRTTIGP
jgi:hypothetical protein